MFTSPCQALQPADASSQSFKLATSETPLSFVTLPLLKHLPTPTLAKNPVRLKRDAPNGMTLWSHFLVYHKICFKDDCFESIWMNESKNRKKKNLVTHKESSLHQQATSQQKYYSRELDNVFKAPKEAKCYPIILHKEKYVLQKWKTKPTQSQSFPRQFITRLTLPVMIKTFLQRK